MSFQKLKKMTVLRAAVLLLAAAFATIFIACPGDGIAIGQVDNRQLPIVDDFTITGLSAIYDGSAKTVSIISKTDKSQGQITTYYEGTNGTIYTKSTTGPSVIGNYDVTFTVAATSEWKQATLNAGTLKITDQSQAALDPAKSDFEITGLDQDHDGTQKTVTIEPKEDKSQGPITIHYTGINGTTYPKSVAKPSAVGFYTVTFDIAAAYGWKAATGLEAGTLTIWGTPVSDDYEINSASLNQMLGSVTDVKITVKANKSTGAVTVKYNNSTTLPNAGGTYAVTFDVTASGAWKAASGLAAGNLVIGDPNLPTPKVDDYDISENLEQATGDVEAVTVTKKNNNKSPGVVTVYYAGTGDTSYNRSSTPPSDPGTYAVTFDVAGVSGWNPASALPAGTLTITGTPVFSDFYFDNLEQEAGSVTAVSINPIEGKSKGSVTIYYNNATALPSAVGTYTVTFDVAQAGVWNSATALLAGTLTIWGTPAAGDYDIGNLNQRPNTVTAVIIAKKDNNRSPGAVSNIRYAGNITIPQAVGQYAVTFDVAASGAWKAASGLSAGTLSVTDEINYGTSLSWGTTYTPTTLGLTPGNTTTEVRVTWYRGSGSGATTNIRFIRGTLIAGKQLINVTGTVAGSSTTAQHKATVTGLIPGESYVYSVSIDGNNWSPMYDFKVPAATGPFKFAVVADPQLTTGAVDANSRYPATSVTTAAGWKETMDIISTKGVSFIVSAGDQVDSSNNETQYNNLFAPEGIKTLPFAPVVGNHDTNVLFFQHYNIPNEQGTENSTDVGANYYYLYNNILFVGLNTSGSSSTSKINTFRTTIQNAKAAHAGKYDWLIVHHHKSTASVAEHAADADIQLFVEQGFETLMSTEKVDFVLAGHDHVYARSYPLQGLDSGKVSVPDKTNGTSQTYTNPGNPIYLTFTTGSGLKYYKVSFDPYFKYGQELYNKNNASYPYLGDVTDNGAGSTAKGSASLMTGNYRPVSTAAFVQPYIPSYSVAEVNGKTIKFSTYAITTKTGTSGAAQAYSFDKDIPYDWVEVTKTN